MKIIIFSAVINIYIGFSQIGFELANFNLIVGGMCLGLFIAGLAEGRKL